MLIAFYSITVQNTLCFLGKELKSLFIYIESAVNVLKGEEKKKKEGNKNKKEDKLFFFPQSCEAEFL